MWHEAIFFTRIKQWKTPGSCNYLQLVPIPKQSKQRRFTYLYDAVVLKETSLKVLPNSGAGSVVFFFVFVILRHFSAIFSQVPTATYLLEIEKRQWQSYCWYKLSAMLRERRRSSASLNRCMLGNDYYRIRRVGVSRNVLLLPPGYLLWQTSGGDWLPGARYFKRETASIEMKTDTILLNMIGY